MKSQKPNPFLEFVDRRSWYELAIFSAITYLLVSLAGCSQMLSSQRDELSARIGDRVEMEVAVQNAELHESLISELRADSVRQVDIAVKMAVASAREEAAAVIREAGADPAKFKEALIAASKAQGVDSQALIDRSIAAAKTDFTNYTDGQITAVEIKLKETDATVEARVKVAAQTAVTEEIQTFEEAAEESVVKATGAASNTGLLTGGAYGGVIAIALAAGQWFLNRRKKATSGSEVAAA